MAFQIAAPYPTLQTLTYLPNPSLSDVRKVKSEVQTRRSINNVLRTYTKSSSTYTFDYNFVLTREKSLELREFIKVYYRATLRITDHNNQQWKVSLTNNPWQFTTDGRAFPVRERVGIALSFEGTEL